MACKHWADCGIKGGGCCTINEYDRPAFSVCRNCVKNTDQKRRDPGRISRGLGDTIKKIINKATLGKVKQCGGCKKRQEALNKLMPYREQKDAN